MFPKELTELKRWVGCTNDSKIPVIPLNPDKNASSTNSDTWCTYEDASVAYGLGLIDNFGFVFYEPDGYVGIDIDCGKDELGFVSDLAWDIISKCKSYTEQSRSGRGYHIILKGKLPFLGRNNQNGVEIYKSSRYFIMTGNQEFFENIIENQEAIDYVISKYFPDYRPSKEGEQPKNERFYSATYKKPQKGRISLNPIYPEIKKGTRNQSLLSLAGQFKAKGYDKRQTYIELLKINNEKCQPPLGSWEIENIVNSCFKYK